MPRKYIPTGKPRGRPKKQTLESSTAIPAIPNTNTAAISTTNTPSVCVSDSSQVTINHPSQDNPNANLEIFKSMICDKEEVVREAVDRFLPTVDSQARGKLAKLVGMIAEGVRWGEASNTIGVTWRDFTRYRLKSKALRDLYAAAAQIGEEARRQERDDEAHDRATAGGSDRLLELLHKEDHPEHYQEQTKPTGTGGGISYTFVIAPPAESGTIPAPQPKVIDI